MLQSLIIWLNIVFFFHLDGMTMIFDKEFYQYVNNEDFNGLSLEGIDHMKDSNFGPQLEKCFTELHVKSVVKDIDFVNTGFKEIIKEYTNLNVEVTTEDSYNAYVFPPDLNKNNVIIEKWRRKFYENLDWDAFVKGSSIIEGVVDLKEGKVHGDFTKFHISIVIGSSLVNKYSVLTPAEITAIVLHELGHVLAYFEMLSRMTRTNYILNEGVRRLSNADNREERIKLLKDIENVTNTTIQNKETIAGFKQSQEVYKTIVVSNSVQESKQDLNLNMYDSRSFEQLADNYASRIGYALPLATGLAKLYKMHGDKDYLSPQMNILFCILRTLGLIFLIAVNPVQGLFILGCILLGGSPLNVTYDPLKQRITKIKQQVNDALKDQKMSLKQKKIYVDEYDEMNKILSELHDNLDVYEAIWAYVFPWGRKQRTDIEAQQQLETLFNNDLFSLSAKMYTGGGHLADKDVAIIILGNEKYIEDHRYKKYADNLYQEIEDILVSKGYVVRRYSSAPYTEIDMTGVKVIVGHSRGIDSFYMRTNYDNPDITIVKVYTLTPRGEDKGHYILSKEDIKALNAVPVVS